MISFDVSSAPDLYIDIDPATFDYTAKDIYSRWKDWVLSGNANWPPAFRTIGGDDLGESRTFPSAYFLRNDRGWLLRKPNGNGEYRIDGNLLAQDTALPTTAEPVGSFTPTIRINLENVSGFDIEALGGTGSFTQDDRDTLEDLAGSTYGIDDVVSANLDGDGSIVVHIPGDPFSASIESTEISCAVVPSVLVDLSPDVISVEVG